MNLAFSFNDNFRRPVKTDARILNHHGPVSVRGQRLVPEKQLYGTIGQILKPAVFIAAGPDADDLVFIAGIGNICGRIA